MADEGEAPTDGWAQESSDSDVVIRGHAFVQNLRRDHQEHAIDARPVLGLVAAFDELEPMI
jgi:hypothetical protein